MKVLASIKLTIAILILIVISSVIGTIIPQGLAEEQYKEKYGEYRYKVMKKLQLFNIYNSYWYSALLAVFCVNLISCTAINLRTTLRSFRIVKRSGETLDLKRLPFYIKLPLACGNANKTEEILSRIRGCLSRVLYRQKYSEGNVIYFEKGKISRLGPLVTHISIVILLVGSVFINRFTFNEYIELPVGKTANVPQSNIDIRLEDFQVQYYPSSNVPKDYVSVITLIEDGVEKVTEAVRVNHPLKYKGIRFYQSSFGSSNDVQIKLYKRSAKGMAYIGSYQIGLAETVQVPNTSLKVRMLEYLPDFVMDGMGNISTQSREPKNPAGLFELYADDKLMFRSWVFKNFPKFHSSVDSEYVIELSSINYFAGIQVTKRPYEFIAWIGFSLMLLGLLFSFCIPYKWIWVRLSSDKIEFGGASYKNRYGFEKESRIIRKSFNQGLSGSG